MSCIQATPCHTIFNIKFGPTHTSNVPNIHHPHHLPSMLCGGLAKHFPICKASLNQKAVSRILKLSLESNTGSPTYYQHVTTGAQRRLHFSPLCLYGGKEKSENDNEASPWKALENAMGSFQKNQSVEDVLWHQIQNKEYYNDGGCGRNRNGGGGSNGGSSSGSSGESEDESGTLDELLQVVLATAGFIFLYIYIIEGEEITRLARDYVKFVFGGQKSVRLKRTMEQWGSFFQKMVRKREPVDPYL